jgi:hypothetical protein
LPSKFMMLSKAKEPQIIAAICVKVSSYVKNRCPEACLGKFCYG